MPPQARLPPSGPLRAFGKYRIFGLLGQGGMGSVYLAEQTGPGGFRRNVVLKLIHADKSARVEQRLLLIDEAQMTALIGHPNVITVFEVGEHLGRVFIALEQVRGVSLATILQRVNGAALPLPVAAALIAQACDGLHAAHELRRDGQPLNLIHRDVSLSNLMCDCDGRVKVIDFGIARADIRKILTDPAAVRGTPAYMAPEQLEGGPLDRRCDIYSCALVFYELCTGAHPFRRSMFRGVAPPLSMQCEGVGPRLDEVVTAALSLEPRGRFVSIATLADALWQAARDGGVGEPAQIAEYFRRNAISLEPPPPREAVDLGLPTGPQARPVPDSSAETRKFEPTPMVLDIGDEREREVLLPDGRAAVMYTTDLNSRERGDHGAALARVPSLLPAPLLIDYVGHALRITCNSDGPAQAGTRAALYVDAHQPQTRLESLLLTESSLPHTFDVGHRKGAIRQVHYTIGRRAGQTTAARPTDVPVTISTVGDVLLLAVLTARDDTGLTHIECIRIWQ